MSVPLTLDSIRELFLKEKYKLVSEEYKDNRTKLDTRCPKGHNWSVSITGWKNGNRCAKCNNNAKMTLEEVRASFEEEDYKLISTEYFNAHTKLDYICPRGHQHYITWSNWNNKKKYRCPKCSNRVSKQELELQQVLKDSNIFFKANHRSIIFNPKTCRPLELDIWIPSLSKAIEFNGEYWHKKQERLKIDNLKIELCFINGIDLLVIWYNEWERDKDFCIKKLNYFLST